MKIFRHTSDSLPPKHHSTEYRDHYTHHFDDVPLWFFLKDKIYNSGSQTRFKVVAIDSIRQNKVPARGHVDSQITYIRYQFLVL